MISPIKSVRSDKHHDLQADAHGDEKRVTQKSGQEKQGLNMTDSYMLILPRAV